MIVRVKPAMSLAGQSSNCPATPYPGLAAEIKAKVAVNFAGFVPPRRGRARVISAHVEVARARTLAQCSLGPAPSTSQRRPAGIAADPAQRSLDGATLACARTAARGATSQVTFDSVNWLLQHPRARGACRRRTGQEPKSPYERSLPPAFRLEKRHAALFWALQVRREEADSDETLVEAGGPE